MTDHPTLTIGDVARITGLTRRALRLYEDAGLLTPQRGPNNYRRYSESDAENARVIHELRAGGLSLDAITALFAIKRSDQSPADRARSARAVLQTMQAELKHRRARIDHALAYIAAQCEAIDDLLSGDSESEEAS